MIRIFSRSLFSVLTLVLLSQCLDVSQSRRGNGGNLSLIDGGLIRRDSVIARNDFRFFPQTDGWVSPNPNPNPGPNPGPVPDTGVLPNPNPNPKPGLQDITNVNLTPEEKDLVDAINDARVKNGKQPLVPDPYLMCAARMNVLDVGGNGSCGHVGSDGSWPWDRAEKCGFPQGTNWTVNEIAAGPGFSNGADAVSGWAQSPGHWAGLIHDQAKLIGVGVYQACYIAVFDCCVAEA
jgi:uncharacterized protein YkwD